MTKSKVTYIRSFHLIPHNSRIFIYGSGAKGLGFFDSIASNRHDIQVAGFLDSFTKGTIRGLRITPFREYTHSPGDIIVVCSHAFTSISKELVSRGVGNISILIDTPIFRTINLGITNSCNAACIFCEGKHNNTSINNIYWSMRDFEAIEKHFKEIDKICFCSGFGEPVLNKNIVPMLKRAKELGKRTHIFIHIYAREHSYEIHGYFWNRGKAKHRVVNRKTRNQNCKCACHER